MWDEIKWFINASCYSLLAHSWFIDSSPFCSINKPLVCCKYISLYRYNHFRKLPYQVTSCYTSMNIISAYFKIQIDLWTKIRVYCRWYHKKQKKTTDTLISSAQSSQIKQRSNYIILLILQNQSRSTMSHGASCAVSMKFI